MPFITVLAIRGRSVEQRRAFAAEVTKLAVDCFGARPEEVRVHFVEMDPSEFARGGQLMSD
ncbi:MAG TPA: tautomerase family protein [Jatrophihabitans sp.]|nr:tautomerase family protein [Jatrophihabitans sp.]